MSTTTAEPPTAGLAPEPPAPELRTYRGRTLEELLPKIREELGPDAIVVRQRDGLMGGLGGFFQQRFVEIEARRGHARVDVYDEPPSMEDFAAQLAAAEEQADPLVSAAPFADALPNAAEPLEPEPAPFDFTAADFASALPVTSQLHPEPKPVREPAAAPETPGAADQRPARAVKPSTTAPAADATEHAALVATLTAHGISDPFARALVADATTHLLPLLPEPDSDARTAVATALARRIPLAPLPAVRSRVVAFAGAPGTGKTRCTAALAAAHAQAGDQPVRVLALDPDDGGAELTRLLAPHGVEVQAVATPTAACDALEQAPPGTLVVLDTPAVSPGDPDAIARLAGHLAQIGLDETHVALPATLSAAVAREQLERLAPLRPDAIALTHADATDHLGALVELACSAPLPLAYVADGRALPGGLMPADPVQIVERLLR